MPNIVMTRSKTPARSRPPSTPRAAKAAPSWSRPSGPAGAGPAASNMSTAKVCIDGEEKYPARREAEAVRPVHAPEPGQARPAAAGRRVPRRVQQARCRGRRGARARPKTAATSPPSPDRLGAAVRILAGLAGGPEPVAQSPGPRRSTSCSPTGRTPAPRPSRSATPISIPKRSIGDRGQPAPKSRGPVRVDRTAYLQPLLQLHLPGADRGDRGRSAGLRISPGQGRLLWLRGRRPSAPSSAMRCGIHWDVDTACGLCPCDGRGFRPGAADPAAAPAGRDQRQRPARSTGRLEVEHAFRQIAQRGRWRPKPRGYTLVNASVEWHPIDDKPGLTLGIAANNLFRRRRAAPFEPAEGLCAAGRARHPAERALPILGRRSPPHCDCRRVWAVSCAMTFHGVPELRLLPTGRSWN